MKLEPQLSIIVASRNDNHGGNILKRTRLFVSGLLEQSRKYRVHVELIIVEWNPIPDKAPLSELLPKPGPDDFLRLRYIVVPPEIHNQYNTAEQIPLYQMTAKNVGIRRAEAEFVLCTNVDILFSDALFQKMISADLRADTFYRANRCDVPDAIEEDWTLDKQLEWCNNNIIKRWGRDPRFRQINLEPLGLNDKSWIKKWLFDKWAIFSKSFWSKEKQLYYQLDLFTCGDFTLMSKDTWLQIEGYAELDLYSIHIDSLAIISAAAMGYEQHVFDRNLCTYHIDHPQGWAAFSPLEKIKWLEKRPGLGYGLLYEAGIYLLENKIAPGINADNWGFAEQEFEESLF